MMIDEKSDKKDDKERKRMIIDEKGNRKDNTE